MARLLVKAVLVVSSAAPADTEVPTDAVVNWVDVRPSAEGGETAPVLGHLHPRDEVLLLDEVSGCYRARLGNGREGYVHKVWTERIPSTAGTLRIVTFSFQVFGTASRPEVMAELTRIRA